MKVTRKNVRNLVFLGIRGLLVFSMILNLYLISVAIFQNTDGSKPEIISTLSKTIGLLCWALLTLVLSLIPDYIEKRDQIDIPDILEIVIVLFIYAGIYLSVRFDLYYRFFWWDDLLHTLSGLIIGFIGFIFMYKLNRNYSMDLNPALVAIFSFTFAVTIGVFWEILEFASDVILETNNQKWNLPDTAILLGKDYQGAGLRDTMSDLIVDSVGALMTSVMCYFLYKNERKMTLSAIARIFNPEQVE
jgi:hypothetical protein